MAKIATFSIAGAVLTATFASGATQSLDLTALPEISREQGLIFGVRTKLQNSYAGIKDPAEAETALAEQIEALLAGEWNRGRAAGEGSSSSKGGRTVQAVVNLTGKSKEEVVALWEALSPAERTALTKRPQVAAEIARIKLAEAEAAAAGAEASDSENDPLAALFAGA